MAFTVEDGTGIEGANSYIDVAFADEYHDDRGNVSWSSLTATQKQQVLIKASEYIDKRFGRRFRGTRQLKRQGLEWPRLSAFDDDGFLLSGEDEVPRQIKKATAEYAIRAAAYNVLAPDARRMTPDQSFGGSEMELTSPSAPSSVKSKTEKVGPVEQSTEFMTTQDLNGGNFGSAARSSQSTNVSDFFIPEYPEADLWIEELVRPINVSMRLARGD